MKDRLSIGFVIDDSLDRFDGVQQYVTTLGQWLERQGHSVVYFAGQTTRQHVGDSPIESMSRNIKVIGNKNRLSIPLWVSRRKINKVLKWYELDILHVQAPFSPFMAGRIITSRAARGVKVIGTFHVVGAGLIDDIGTRALGFFQRRQQSAIDTHIFVSEAAKEYSRHYFRDPVGKIIPNMIDVSRFKNASKQRDKVLDKSPTILFLGRLVERKGCEHLIHAFAILKNEKVFASTKLIIGGAGPRKNYIQELIDGYQLSASVRLLGFVPEDRKASLLRSADICVFPSLHGESFGIILLEAIAAGSLVVGGDNPGYRTVLGSEYPQTIVNPRDYLSFAGTLSTLLKDEGMRDAIKKHQTDEVLRKYDINIVGPKILTEYKTQLKL